VPKRRLLADEHTPLSYRNAWYVACFSEDVPHGRPFGRKLAWAKKRSLLPQVRWHRSCNEGPLSAIARFPLSAKPAWMVMRIVCGYHGIRYDSGGFRLQARAQRRRPRPRGLGRCLLSKRLKPRRWSWIWMGDPAVAEAHTRLPAGRPWMLDGLGAGATSAQTTSRCRPATYSCTRTCLDLSHLDLSACGDLRNTPDYAKAPYETELDSETIIVRRTVQPTRLAPDLPRIPSTCTAWTAARIFVTSTVLDTRPCRFRP